MGASCLWLDLYIACPRSDRGFTRLTLHTLAFITARSMLVLYRKLRAWCRHMSERGLGQSQYPSPSRYRQAMEVGLAYWVESPETAKYPHTSNRSAAYSTLTAEENRRPPLGRGLRLNELDFSSIQLWTSDIHTSLLGSLVVTLRYGNANYCYECFSFVPKEIIFNASPASS